MDSRDEQIHDTITINKISHSNHLIKNCHYTTSDMIKGFVEGEKQHAKPCSERKITDITTNFHQVSITISEWFATCILMPIDLTFKGSEFPSVTSIVDFELGTTSWEWQKTIILKLEFLCRTKTGPLYFNAFYSQATAAEYWIHWNNKKNRPQLVLSIITISTKAIFWNTEFISNIKDVNPLMHNVPKCVWPFWDVMH